MNFDENKYSSWMEKYIIAKNNSIKYKSRKGILIEVAAQHPLINGNQPNDEFTKRLLLGIELYKKFVALEHDVKIYVPGSIHMENGIADKISLSEAGCNFLVNNGIPRIDLYGEDANVKYKCDLGVYNSSDECYVSAQLFDELKFSELHCVCSSAQMMRKVLSYIQFGYLPYMHTVTTDQMFHNYIDEIFKFIPIVIDDDDALQGDSKEADRLRALRNPNLML